MFHYCGKKLLCSIAGLELILDGPIRPEVRWGEWWSVLMPKLKLEL